jgi:hypothetical protein
MNHNITPSFLRHCGKIEAAKMAGWLASAVASAAASYEMFQSPAIADLMLAIIFAIINGVCSAQTIIQFQLAKEFFDQATDKESKP